MTENNESQLIGLTLSGDMFRSLKSIADRDYNSIQGVIRKYISAGIAADEQNQVA